MWLKRKLNPFDVINVSITAFAHKISMEIIEKGVILWRKCLGMTYWILFLPEYQYSVCAVEQLQNYMIFHWTERLKLLYYIHEKKLMVRYFLCSNEQPLQFTAEVMRNFLSLLHDELYLLTRLEFKKRSEVGCRHLLHKKMISKGSSSWMREGPWGIWGRRFSICPEIHSNIDPFKGLFRKYLPVFGGPCTGAFDTCIKKRHSFLLGYKSVYLPKGLLTEFWQLNWG